MLTIHSKDLNQMETSRRSMFLGFSHMTPERRVSLEKFFARPNPRIVLEVSLKSFFARPSPRIELGASLALVRIMSSALTKAEKKRLTNHINRLISFQVRKPSKLERLFRVRGGVREFFRKINGMFLPLGLGQSFHLVAENHPF